MENAIPDETELRMLATARMPFGKFRGRPLFELPEEYISWILRNNVAKGRLAMILTEIYEIRLNGLEDLLRKVGALVKEEAVHDTRYRGRHKNKKGKDSRSSDSDQPRQNDDIRQADGRPGQE